MGTQLFHADRRTDRHSEVNSSFSQFCERALKHTICVTGNNGPIYHNIICALIKFLVVSTIVSNQ